MISSNKKNDDFELGVDIVFKKRLKKILLSGIKRILTKNEFDIFCLLKTKKQKIEYLSSRWASKEAIYKALPDDLKLSLCDIEILNNSSGRPYCTNFNNIKLSISYSKYYVVCICAFIHNN
ncbi:MAG: 4'-phosphopantetheinyl transferase superfamily protein [Malacoplasma sp.]